MDFAFLLFASRPREPFITPHCRLTRNSPLSLHNTLPVATPMLFCPVLAKLHRRRSLDPHPSLISTPSPLLVLSEAEGSRNSHGINSFAGPHPLNPIVSIFYENHGGRGHFQPSPPGTPPSPSRICLSFQLLARRPSRKSFHLMTFHFHGGGTPKLPTIEPANIPIRPQSISFRFTLLRTLLHIFAPIKNSTLFFSIDSALFAKKHRGWGGRVSDAGAVDPERDEGYFFGRLRRTGYGTQNISRPRFSITSNLRLSTANCLKETRSDDGRRARQQSPCGEAHPGNISCGARPTPRCLRGFLFSAK